jgi:tetratricopeptide (TPR) repeat protein
VPAEPSPPTSSAAGRTGSRADLLAALSAQLDSGGDPHLATIERCVERADSPELADLLRRAAIPRLLDGPTVAALLELSVEQGEALLDTLQRYPFVRPHPSGGFAYHDGVRDSLRRWWVEPERVEDFRVLARRLVQSKSAALAECRQLSRELQLARDTLRAANPARLTTIRTAVEWRLAIALKEALYHAHDAGRDDVQQFLIDHMKVVESEPRLIELAAGELPGLREDLTATDAGTTLARGWLCYLEGRFRQQLGQHEQSLDLLRRPLAEIASDDSAEASKLRHWLLGEMGNGLLLLDRLPEAEQAYVASLAALGADHDVDLWNLAAAHQRLGDLQMALMQLTEAVASLERAVEAAQRAQNDQSVVLARLQLAQGHAQLGNREAALAQVGRAVHESRTLPARRLASALSPTDDLETHRQVAVQLMRLVSRSDLRVVDTLLAEGVGLSAGPTADASVARMIGLRAELLTQHGALDRAEDDLDHLAELSTELDDLQRTELELLGGFLRAHVHRHRGRFGESLQAWDVLVDHSGADDASWARLAARSNRADLLILTGRLDEAREELTAAAERWRGLGVRAYDALVTCRIAEVCTRQGRTAEANAMLDAAANVLLSGDRSLAEEYHRGMAANLTASGDVVEALEHARLRAAAARDGADDVLASRALDESAVLATLAGQWSLAAQLSGEAQREQLRLQRAQERRPSAAETQADELVQAAALIFFEGSDQRRHDLEAARRRYGEALELDPDNAWLHVCRYYVCMEQGDANQAEQELRRLRQLDADWLRPWLADRSGVPATPPSAGSGAWGQVAQPIERVGGWLRRALGGSKKS